MKTKEKTNIFKQLGRSLKQMISRLFGINKNESEITVLEEEQLMSPSKVIFRNFIRNRLALIGIIVFLFMVFFSFGLSAIIPYDEFYSEPTLGNLAPNNNYLRFPRALEKEGIKKVNDEVLLASGNSFSVGVSAADNIYVWGANTANIKEVPQNIQERARDIVMLAAGNKHISVVVKDPVTGVQEVLFWGSNNHSQAQYPEVVSSGDDKAERTQISRYFSNTENNYYRFPVEISPPKVTTFEIDYENSSKTNVILNFDYQDNYDILDTVSLRYDVINKSNPSFNDLKKNVTLYSRNDNIDYKKINITTDESKFYLFALKIDFVSLDGTVAHYSAPLPFNSFPAADSDYVPSSINLFDASMRNKAQRYEEIDIGGINSDPIKKIDADYDYTSILTERGKLLTWGSVSYSVNRLGNTIMNDPNNPIIDFDTAISNIIALRADNSIVIFGLTGDIYSGINAEEAEMLAQFRKPLNERTGKYAKKITDIALTHSNGIVLTEDNVIYTWGKGSTNINMVPDEIKEHTIESIESGHRHVVLLTTDGLVYAWGENDLKQINVPKNLKNIENISVDYFQNYAIDDDGQIHPWGNKGFLFGTDDSGRSLLIRLIQGGRVSMTVGAIAVLISLTIGTIVGLTAGFYGGVIDNILMRFGEIINAFPFLPLAITLSAFIGTNMTPENKMYLIMIILGVLSWPGLARLIRGQILSEREKDFVLAAKALGIKERHVIMRHILPSVVNIIIVNTTLAYAGSLLTEAGLSFLGFGVQKPYPSWGNLLDDAKKMENIELYWWKWIMPALCIIVTALSINLVGDGLREAMDPKSNER